MPNTSGFTMSEAPTAEDVTVMDVQMGTPGAAFPGEPTVMPDSADKDCTCTRTWKELAVALERQLAEQKSRDRLLLERISHLDDQLQELRQHLYQALDENVSKKRNKSKKKKDSSECVDSSLLSNSQSSRTAANRTNKPASVGGVQNDLIASAEERPRGYAFGRLYNPSEVATKASTSSAQPKEKEHPITRARSPSRSRLSDSSSDDEFPAKHVPLVLPLADSDDDFELVSHQKARPLKKKHLFVGNIAPTSTAEKLTKYILGRKITAPHDIQVHSAKVFPVAEGRDSVFAKILVNDRDVKTLCSKAFWPGHLYCRNWYRKEPPTDLNSTLTEDENSAEASGQPFSSLASDKENSPPALADITPRGKARFHESRSPQDEPNAKVTNIE